LIVCEAIGSKCSDNESDDVQFATASSAPSALSATLMWEDMTNYVGQREQFVDNCGPQNEAQNETHCTKVFKMFFDDELVERLEPLLKKGCTLWMDSFYNSPALAQRLKSLKTDCVGTFRLSGKDAPQTVKDKKLKKGELVAQH